MAQQAEIIWTALVLTHANLLLVPALLALVDAVTGFSTALARRVKRSRAADLVLLIWILPASWLALRGLSALFAVPVIPFADFEHVEDLRRFWAEQHSYWTAVQSVENVLRILVWAQFAAAAACLVWAVRLKHTIWVWLPLSLLANFGGLIWLLLRGHTSAVQEG